MRPTRSGTTSTEGNRTDFRYRGRLTHLPRPGRIDRNLQDCGSSSYGHDHDAHVNTDSVSGDYKLTSQTKLLPSDMKSQAHYRGSTEVSTGTKPRPVATHVATKDEPHVLEAIWQARRPDHALNEGLTVEYEEFADGALSASRKVDQSTLGISESILQIQADLKNLEQVMQSTRNALSSSIDQDISSVSTDYSNRLANLHATYKNVDSNRIGKLQKRLEISNDRVEIIKERMDKVRTGVEQSEHRDVTESQRSRRRHIIFWSVISMALLFIFWFVSPGFEIQTPLKSHATLRPAGSKTLRTSAAGLRTVNRLNQVPSQGRQDNARLNIFNEL